MQQELFHEDLNSALSHVISALGGPKKVGKELWPALTVDNAGRKVNHCLNDQHAQDFKPHEIIWLLTEAGKKGIHSAMAYICSESGYETPQRLNPETEMEKLQRQYIQAVNNLKTLSQQFERVSSFASGQ